MSRRRDFSVDRTQLVSIQVLVTHFSCSHTEKCFFEDPELSSDVDMSYMSHKEKYEEAIRRITVVLKKIKKLQSEGRGGKDLHK